MMKNNENNKSINVLSVKKRFIASRMVKSGKGGISPTTTDWTAGAAPTSTTDWTADS